MKNNVSSTSLEQDISYDTYGIYKKVKQDQKLKDAINKVSSGNTEEDEGVKAAKNTLKMLIDRITMMDGKDFTRRSWKRLMRTLDTALTARSAKNPTARDINRAARMLLNDISRLTEAEKEKVQSNETEKNTKLMNDSMRSIMRAKQESAAEKVSASAQSVAGAYEMGKMTSTQAVAATPAPVVEVTL